MSKEYHIIISESEYMDLNPQFRQRAKAVFNDYNEHKDDPIFKTFYKEYRKAKKKLEDYKYDKRHS